MNAKQIRERHLEACIGFAYKVAPLTADAAAVELETLRARVKMLEESIKKAIIKLHATQRNWDEECLFDCNDILESAIAAALPE